MQSRYLTILLPLLLALALAAGEASASTGWSPIIIPTGAYRAQIQAQPIEQRPGRPLHVYGNTIRLIEHARQAGRVSRPLRQIFVGTPTPIL